MGAVEERKLFTVLGLIGIGVFLQNTFPILANWHLLERLLSSLVAAAVTEIMLEKFSLTGDFGPIPYLLAAAYPAVFPLASITLHSYTSGIPIYSDLQSMILGNEYKVKFRGDANFREVQSEHMATSNIESIAAETKKSYYIREGIVLAMFITVFTLIHGSPGIAIAAVCFITYLTLQYQGGSNEVVRTKDSAPIPEKKGVYAIEMCNLWSESHVGVGYLYNGTFTTKYHVTNGKPIFIGDRFYNPCYYNLKADIVSYGAPPEICDVSDGDSILVALSGPHSDVIVTYATKATVNSEGYVMFTGKKSMPGTSGSPFFKRASHIGPDGKEVIEYKFAGCLGWAVKAADLKPNLITELAMNTGLGVYGDSITRGEITQHIDHPGAGKTRNIASLIQQGLHLYGKVYIAGPTRGVANELVRAYQDNPVEEIVPRILIKGATKSRIPSKVTITTHATALRMLLKKDSSMSAPGLWILDESHFPDKATQALKHYLRHCITQKITQGSLYEMTATAYHISEKKWSYADGSNYPITDTMMSKEKMVDAIMRETRRCIVFTSSIKGKEKTSSDTLKQELQRIGKRVLDINRATFLKTYEEAKTNIEHYDVILTTNIAECGVNLDVDVCYDFQEGPKPIVMRYDDIVIRNTPITKSQYVQRRGRVGRIKPGEYIAPHSKFELQDVIGSEAYHLDVALFLNDYGITPMEPVYLTDVACNYTCTHEQILYLFTDGEDAGINSALTLRMLVDEHGRARDPDSIMAHARRWNNGGEVTRRLGDYQVEALYWDDRDSELYWRIHKIFDVSPDVDDRDRDRAFTSVRKILHQASRSMYYRALFLKRPSHTPPVEYEVSDDESGGEKAEKMKTAEASTST